MGQDCSGDSWLFTSRKVTAGFWADVDHSSEPITPGGSSQATANSAEGSKPHYVKKPDTPVGAVLKQRSGYGKGNGQRQRQKLPSRVVGSQPLSTKCSQCGKSPSHDHKRCPAQDVVCQWCAKRGHFQSVCRSTGRSTLWQGEVFLGTLAKQGDNPNSSLWAVTVSLNGKPLSLR